MNAQHMNEDDSTLNHFFKITMRKQWKEVVSFYTTNSWAQKAKLTKSEDTALHVAISNYHPGRSGLSVNYVKEMLDSTSKNEAFDLLSMQNDKGNTPLHLAAKVGWVAICESIASQHPKLVTIRNADGETPLFVAARHGKTEAFLCLYQIYNDKSAKSLNAKKERDQESAESLCRRKDGNTVLHSAITGAYFTLAYQIIFYIPKLVDSVNIDGESPLHVLAKVPSVFKSSSHLGFYDSIIYHCTFIDELKKQRFNPRADDVPSPKGSDLYPRNYQTCVNIFLFLWNPISESFKAGLGRDTGNLEHGGSNDVESQHRTRNELQKGKSRVQSYFPANYATAILLYKFAVTVILSILGGGFLWVKEIQERKKRYSHALQIMNMMIDSESRYKYGKLRHDGQKPVEERYNFPFAFFLERFTPPAESDTPSGVVKKNETPLLVAAKMGIPEMVEQILTTCPVAIHDLDSDGKNVLLLAAENRQTTVFDLLLKGKPTEDMFHQVDNQGNSILHLAATMRRSLPWRLPGASLRMQWEVNWYKYVKYSIPSHYLAHQNNMGQTPGKIFTETHKELVKEGAESLIKTSESCSFVAALIASVTFATSTTVPGGLDGKTGRPVLVDHRAFDVFAISSFIALSLSVTALIFFLAIINFQRQEHNFERDLSKKLLTGLTCLFSSIAAMLVSFCAGHTLILRDELRTTAVPIYAFACVPMTLFTFTHLSFYFDLLMVTCSKMPLSANRVFYQ